MTVLRLLRIGNLAMVLVAVALGALLANPAWNAELGRDVSLAFVAALSITAFGNILNDVRDVAVDRAAHPTRPLVTGAVSVRAATRLAYALLAVGLVASAFAWPQPLLAIAAANAAVLIAYEWRLKAWPLVGNIAVAYLVASTFLFGALAVGAVPPLAWLLAGLAFFSNLGRELAKDIEDADADAATRRTAATAWGKPAAARIGSIAIGIAAAASLAPWWMGPGPDWALRLGLAASGILHLLPITWLTARPRHSQQLLKLAMLVALAAAAVHLAMA